MFRTCLKAEGSVVDVEKGGFGRVGELEASVLTVSATRPN